ncbi:MAG: anti-sigma factor family protein [Candidatus Longimicrobiales bacterium M2_2A_002]
MPHVDDGTLHALLDGALRAHEPDRADRVEAHLDACADCRARLEEAAALRDRAADVLADLDAEPADDASADREPAPDFQDVLARAAGSAGTDAGTGGEADRGGADPAPGLRRRLAWTRGLAWAATIVVALGTGYLVRDLADPTGAVPRAVPTESADRVREPAAPEPTPAVEAGADLRDQAPEPRAQAAQPEAAAGRPPATDEGAGAAKMRQTEALEAAPEAEATNTVAPSPSAAERGEVGMMGVAADAQWRAVSVEEAEAGVGPLLVLPGAAVAAVELADDGTVRSRQRVSERVEVMVVQEDSETAVARAVHAMAPAEAVPTLLGLDLDSAAATVAAPVTVTVVRDAASLTLTAQLPEDVLQALAATAAPRTP